MRSASSIYRSPSFAQSKLTKSGFQKSEPVYRRPNWRTSVRTTSLGLALLFTFAGLNDTQLVNTALAADTDQSDSYSPTTGPGSSADPTDYDNAPLEEMPVPADRSDDAEPEERSAISTQKADGSYSAGFYTGFRSGIEIPFGDVAQERKGSGAAQINFDIQMRAMSPWLVPVWLDIGYLFSDGWELGAFGQLGLGGVGSSCIPEAQSCEWYDFRLGLQVNYNFPTSNEWSGWIGLGANWEWHYFDWVFVFDNPDPSNGAGETVGLRIRERLNGPSAIIQGGVDLYAGGGVKFGLFGVLMAGTYLGDEFTDCPSIAQCESGTGPNEGAALRGSATLGLRMTYGP